MDKEMVPMPEDVQEKLKALSRKDRRALLRKANKANGRIKF